MRLETLFNRVHRFNGFVCSRILWKYKSKDGIVIQILPRKNTRPICSVCHKKGSIYDTQPDPRFFKFVPLWGLTVVLLYFMRRVACNNCGVKVEQVPWAEGKSPLTYAFKQFLAFWALSLIHI